MKDYSGNLNVKYLKDKESLISRTLSYHLDDEFIISDIEGLMVEIATNFEKEYIKLKYNVLIFTNLAYNNIA